MAGYVGAKVVRIIPDQPGRGGSKSSLSTQSVNLDIREAHNVFVKYGRWTRAPEAVPAELFFTVLNVAHSLGLHDYAAFDTTNAALPPTDKILSHNLMTNGSHTIAQHNPIFFVKTYTPVGDDAAVPATFLNIKNRCFICWAATNNFIYDSPNSKEYDVGVDAPQTAATYTFGDVDSGLAAAAAGNIHVNWITSTTSGFTNDAKQIVLNGVTYQLLQPNPLVTTFTSGNCTGTATMTSLTINGQNWPLGDYLGLQIFINVGGGETHYINDYTWSGPDTTVTLDTPLVGSPAADPYTLDGIGNSQLILASPYTGDTSLGITFTVFEGPLAWDGTTSTAPQYAYAYYDDPATNTVNGYGTGHISNISPITYVTEKSVGGVSVVLHDIMDSGVEDQARFNKIQIFRTIINGGGAVLFPFEASVGLIDNDGSGPHDFTDSFDDSFLLSAFPDAPRTSNRKPPPFAHQAYWDGRIFGNPVNDPSAIVFSGSIADITYGVPEECYPSNNILRIPSDDGRVTGMKLVGPIVVITTERYAYYVIGGPSATTYSLRRFSTMMYGVGDYQMAEFAGQTTDDSDAVLYLGKDKMVYLTAPSVGNIPMSEPVQNIFNSDITTNYALCRIADVSLNGNHYIIVTLEDQTEIYDFNRKIWTDHIVSVKDQGPVQPQAFCKVYGSTVPVKFLFINNGFVYEWLGENNTTGTLTSYVATNPIMLGEKARWLLSEVRLYVSDNSEPWGVATSVNEGGGFQWPAIEQPDPLNSLQTTFPLDSPTAKELIMVPFVQDQPIQAGYRFQVIVNWPGDNVLRELYAIDILLTRIEEEGQAAQ